MTTPIRMTEAAFLALAWADHEAHWELVDERGTLAISSLPDVTVDLDALFAMLD